MNNMSLAGQVLRSLWAVGVREVIVCAGARNAPLVTTLAAPGPWQVHSFFEERSAGFFALGRMQAEGRPVAVITTSGTAAAELLPAVIEADYQGLALIAVTADRPRRYRGSGAPQAIVQPGLYSHYVERGWDLEGEVEEIRISGRRPVHINICFDEPLIDGPVNEFAAPAEVAPTAPPPPARAPEVAMRAPLILVSGLPKSEVAGVRDWLRSARRPLYIEAASQLMGDPELKEWRVGEADLKHLSHDGVIRIGGVPTLRLWRDLESSNTPVVHFSHLPFSGLPRAPEVFPLSQLLDLTPRFTPWTEQKEVHARAQKLHARLDEFPLSEPAWVRWLSRQIPQGVRLFLGNSLPIREWDLAAEPVPGIDVFVNRGVNGIDGLVSTFLGLAHPQRSNWALIGDLSALYDLSGPWAARALGACEINLVILNNGGGKIFHRMFNNPLFENQHGLHFENWAKMWSWDYLRLDKPAALGRAHRPRVVEIIPLAEQTHAFWEAK